MVPSVSNMFCCRQLTTHLWAVPWPCYTGALLGATWQRLCHMGAEYVRGKSGDVAGKAGKSLHVAPGRDFCQGTGGRGGAVLFWVLKT